MSVSANRQAALLAVASAGPSHLVKVEPVFKDNMNTLMLVMDQLVAYHMLPTAILDKMKGYQAFKKLGVEFTHIHNNRQDCSPSRGSFQSSQINIGIQDNIDQPYQYDYVKQLETNHDTIGKSFKTNKFDITGYYGKVHLVSTMASNLFLTPMFNSNTVGSMKQYGFDRFNMYGDAHYVRNEGYFGDSRDYQTIVNNAITDVDYTDPATGQKYLGALPFLKARNEDRKSYHMQYHITNPHDTMHFWQNYSQTPTGSQLQYWSPFLEEQTVQAGYTNPYKFSNVFPNAYIQDTHLTTNYFEPTYYQYSNERRSLPFLSSYEADYATNPKQNSAFPFNVGMTQSFAINFSFPDDANDVKSWKNLVNNYYGLILEADNYVYNIFTYLEQNDMLREVSVIITADHGDMMGAHGLKQKGFPYKESTNVCCLVYSPFLPVSLRNTKSNVLGSLLDLAPTLEVLGNLTIKSSKFTGQSLLEWDDKELAIRSNDVSVVNIYNSWMTSGTYFTYAPWYKKQDSTIQAKVYNSPETFFEYMCHFSMYMEKIEGVLYKYARFYTIREIFAYNFVYNDKLPVKLTVDIINNNIPKIIKTNKLINFAPDVTSLQTTIINWLIANRASDFTFSDMYDELKTVGTDVNNNKNSTILSIFMAAITEYLNDTLGLYLLIPGSGLSFQVVTADPHYYTFGFNLDDDPHELVNLLDPQYPSRQTTEVVTTFTKMNADLNTDINTTYNMTNFQYILPSTIMYSVLVGIKIYGQDVPDYTSGKMQSMTTFFDQSNMDSTMAPRSSVVQIE